VTRNVYNYVTEQNIEIRKQINNYHCKTCKKSRRATFIYDLNIFYALHRTSGATFMTEKKLGDNARGG